MLEFYQAYGDYDTMATLLRELIQEAAAAVTGGSHVVTHADGTEFDLGGEWRSVTLFGAISEALGEEVNVRTAYEQLVRYADKLEISVDPKWGPGKLAEELFEWCRTRLAYFKAPGWVLFVPSLPTTGTQKVQKSQIFPRGADPRQRAGAVDLRDRKRRR